MSIVISIGGRQLSGKSTLAAHLGMLAAYLLELPASVSLSGKKKDAPRAWVHRDPRDAFPTVPLVAAVHGRNPASALPYRHLPPYAVRRHVALKSVAGFAAEASGGVFVADSCTAWYDEATRAWVSESNASRERAGKSPHAFLGPEAFREINDSYWSALAASQREPAATIFVHREGSEMFLDGDFGMISGASTHLRGQAEAGADSPLVLLLSGGLRSGNRPTGERRLFVAADAAQLATGRSEELPQLRGAEEVAELRRVLWRLLAPSLLWLKTAAVEEKEAWDAVSEMADDFPGARRAGERTEAAMLLDQIQTLLASHRLTSTAADVQGLVRPMLTEAIGWGSLTAAAEHGASVEVLRQGLELLKTKAPAAAELLAHEAEMKKAPKKAKAADPAAAPVDPFLDIPEQLG